MKVVSKLLYSIWSIILLVLLSVASPVGVSGMSILSIVYDEQVQLSGTHDGSSAVVYDGVGKSLLRYDAVPVLFEVGSKHGLDSDHVLVAKFLRFLAAKTGVQDATYLYQKVGAQGEHLKFGITKNPATRYTQEELAQLARAGRTLSATKSNESDETQRLSCGRRNLSLCSFR